MNRKTLFTFLSVCLLFCSCSHIYEPALYQQDIAYQPKPASFDTVKTANYISGGYNANPNSNNNDFLQSGQVNLSRGHVFDNFNLAYGAFGVLGNYQNQGGSGAAGNFKDKFFGAYGGRASADVFVNSGRVDFRIIGVEMAYSHEFGSYSRFRQFLNTQPGYYVDPRTDLFSAGITTEVIFHNVKNVNFQHGIRLFLGTTFGHNELDDTFYSNESAQNRAFDHLFPKASYFMKIKNFFVIIEKGKAGSTFAFVRLGYKF